MTIKYSAFKILDKTFKIPTERAKKFKFYTSLILTTCNLAEYEVSTSETPNERLYGSTPQDHEVWNDIVVTIETGKRTFDLTFRVNDKKQLIMTVAQEEMKLKYGYVADETDLIPLRVMLKLVRGQI